MSDTLKAICGILLSGALVFACGEQVRPGCTNDNVVLSDQPCLDTTECPECGPVCEARGGTRVSGPACVEEVGFGSYCVCTCEFCNDAGTGGTGGSGGGTGGAGGGTGGSGGNGGNSAQ